MTKDLMELSAKATNSTSTQINIGTRLLSNNRSLAAFLKNYVFFEPFLYRLAFGDFFELRGELLKYARPCVKEIEHYYERLNDPLRVLNHLNYKETGLRLKKSVEGDFVLEFRMFNTTLNPIFIQNYFMCCGRLIEMSINEQSSVNGRSSIKGVNFNPYDAIPLQKFLEYVDYLLPHEDEKHRCLKQALFQSPNFSQVTSNNVRQLKI